MTMKKFITMDLDTGKKVLQTIEASFIKFSDEQHFPGVTNLDAALKAEVARAVKAENALTTKVDQEIQRAEDAEAAIKTLIGDLGQDKSVKEALDRITGLINTLTEKVDNHIANEAVHLVAGERDKWNKAVADVATKADKDTMAEELGRKVARVDLIASDGKIKTDLLPSIAINSVETVDSVDAAMRLPIENGDVVIINPDAKVARTQKQVVSGTFICVDDKGDTFDKKFRQLYSNSDSISKAEVEKLIKVEADRAKEAERDLAEDITTINGDENQPGSIQYFVKSEEERATTAEEQLAQRLTTIEPIVTKLNGDESESGSAANLANKALTDAKAYTDEKITEVKSDATTLSGKVTVLETKVGDEQQGLVKDVAELQGQVAVINGSEEGSIKKALADAKKHADDKVADEQTARKAEDKKLSDRLDSLEASENLSITLGCVGIEQHELLAIRADNTVVKATLTDSSVVGIVARAKGPNSKTVVSGRVSGLEGLTPGRSYYLGENGKITDKIPTEVGEHIIKVGVALTETDLFVNIQEAIRIGD